MNSKFHELRHTHASMLVAKDIDIKTVQHRLGHASASLTMDLYVHPSRENDENAAKIIGNLINTAPSDDDTTVHLSAG